MCMKNLFGRKFLLSGDWDRVIAALPDKDGNTKLSADDYVNRAFARCFQVTKDHRDGNYSDVVSDATKALIENCKNTEALCAQAYGFYLNGNYEQAISVCEKIICRKECDIKEKEKKDAKVAWDAACKKQEEAKKAQETADTVQKYPDAAQKSADAAKAAQEASEIATADAMKAVNDANNAQEKLLQAYKNAVFAHELLGKIYADMSNYLEASRHYKKALLYRQLDPLSASPLLMDAYREACKRVKAN